MKGLVIKGTTCLIKIKPLWDWDLYCCLFIHGKLAASILLVQSPEALEIK